MTADVLLLNADHSPIKVISWEKAVCLLLDEKVRIVTEYAGRLIRSANMSMAFPAVVALVKYARTNTKVRFNRSNVLARDAFTCQYCGVQPKNASGGPRLDDLTLDHVVPRAQSKNSMVTLPWNKERVSVTCWENVVAACAGCNSVKADRTPAQAGMKLKTLPRKPSAWDCIRMTLMRRHIPREWRQHLPTDSPWKDYWEIELSED